jgi:hypothetical protein
MNVQSSTEGELVAVDDAATMILWTKLFLEAQGYDVDKNIVHQDNKSAILLETNGKKSSGKRTRTLNIRYFFITDQVEKGNTQIEHCGTHDMIGNFFYIAFARQKVPKISEGYPWTLTRRTRIHARQSVTSHETERTFQRTEDTEQQ